MAVPDRLSFSHIDCFIEIVVSGKPRSILREREREKERKIDREREEERDIQTDRERQKERWGVRDIEEKL